MLLALELHKLDPINNRFIFLELKYHLSTLMQTVDSCHSVTGSGFIGPYYVIEESPYATE